MAPGSAELGWLSAQTSSRERPPIATNEGGGAGTSQLVFHDEPSKWAKSAPTMLLPPATQTSSGPLPQTPFIAYETRLSQLPAWRVQFLPSQCQTPPPPASHASSRAALQIWPPHEKSSSRGQALQALPS